jgi:hypothetical protein
VTVNGYWFEDGTLFAVNVAKQGDVANEKKDEKKAKRPFSDLYGDGSTDKKK